MLATDSSARASAQVCHKTPHQKKPLPTRRRSRRARYDDTLIAKLRIDDLNKLFRHRYGDILPDDDAGRDDAFVAFSHYAVTNRVVHFHSWLDIHAPWMKEQERDRLVWRKPLRWTADKLGERLGLRSADRDRLGIRTIGAIDMPRAERDALRKAKHRERSRQHAEAKRRGAGKPTRQEWLAQHQASRVKPWKMAGMSRAKWYRLQRETGGLTNIEAKLQHIKQPVSATQPKRRSSVARTRPAAPSGSLRSRDLAPRAAAPLVADGCALARAERAVTALSRRPIAASPLSEIQLAVSGGSGSP